VAEGSERNTELPPFNEFVPVAIGTAIWALLFVIGLVIRPDLEDSGRGWWVWTAAAGVVLGLFGVFYVGRRRARLLKLVRDPRRPDQS
jgi:Protein of unknown function (DUF2530)